MDENPKSSSKQPKRDAVWTVKSRVRRIISGTAKGGRNNANAEYPNSAAKIDESRQRFVNLLFSLFTLGQFWQVIGNSE